MAYKAIMGLVPTLHATSLVGENLKVVKKKKVETGDLMKLGVKNIVGIELIKLESGLIGGL